MRDDIHVVLDSLACSGETSLKDDPRCHVLRLIARHGDREWLDGDVPVKELFEMVERSGKLPTTSQPPIGTIIEMFTELVQAGKKVLVITVDSVLSGTYQTCCVAAKQVMSEIKGADIRVVDSKTAACPISGMALDALRGVDAGMSLDEVETLVRDYVARTDTYFSVNTLEYLQKGGRIGAVGALIGSIFGIRPIIHLDRDGKLEVADKVRTRKKALKRLIELSSQNPELETIYVAHADAEEDALGLEQGMKALYPGVPTLVTGIGTALAAHLGPGVVGIFVRRKAQ